VDSASLPDPLCVEHGCNRTATFWSSALSTRMPTLCDTHADEMRQQFSQRRELPQVAVLDDSAEVNALRARLRLAENVCYYAQRLLKESTMNLDVNIPALRTAIREWTREPRS